MTFEPMLDAKLLRHQVASSNNMVSYLLPHMQSQYEVNSKVTTKDTTCKYFPNNRSNVIVINTEAKYFINHLSKKGTEFTYKYMEFLEGKIKHKREKNET